MKIKLWQRKGRKRDREPEGDASVTETGNRWFPGQDGASVLIEGGWVLAGGERWNAEEFQGGVDLTGLRLSAPGVLELDFLAEVDDVFRFQFRDIVDMELYGSFCLEPGVDGWEVFETSMLRSERPRSDGMWVYRLWACGIGSLCFASQLGVALK